MVRAMQEVSERIQRLREKVVVPPAVCIERGYLVTESYKETEGEPVPIRKAKALKNVLEKMPIHIDDDELIVGNITSKPRAAVLLPEIQWKWYLDQMDYVASDEWERYAPFSEEEKSKMKEFLPYWKGKSLFDMWTAMIPENFLKLNNKIQSGGGYANNCMGSYGHVCADNEKVLSLGLNGIKTEVKEQLEKLNLANYRDLQKYHFYNSTLIAMDAAITFTGRYAALAGKMAAKETNIRRKAELEKIAETCSQVPAKPARNFYEAVQCSWFMYALLMIESFGPGTSFGRPDQYLYPFYQNDIKDGKITRDEARELVACMYIKANSVVSYFAREIIRTYAGFAIIANITLGGLTKDGKDAVNELSYLFLDAEADVRLSQEDLIIRIHKNTPDAFVMKACEVAKLLKGKFKFLSDETTIQQLMNDGKPIDYARDFIITGCNSPGVQAHSLDVPGGIINLPLMLELALNNGASRLSGEQIGPKTGDPRQFKSYDEVWNAFKKQVEALIPVCLTFKNADKFLYSQYGPVPFMSSVTGGCIEKGLDINNGGTAPYISHAMSLGGSPNVGDSLAAIKKAVFEDKKISMSQLIDALEKDFVGEEKLLHILEACPKFGNDDDYVDMLVNDVLMCARDEAVKVRGFAGALSTVAGATITGNVPLGAIVGALPDGRRSGTPLADGGLSPTHGRNVNGPTATLRSVAKLNHVKISHGSVLNMRFNPEVLKDEQKMRKFASLIRTFCETGGALVQFNIVGSDTLKDAQKHPEKYKDLLVRVATYSSYFVELSPELQNDIIDRTEFEEV
jgi:choline trimethylamine-lyase